MAAILAGRPGERFCRAESVAVVRTIEEVMDDVVWAAPWIGTAELVHIPSVVQLSPNRVGEKRHHVAQAQLLSRRETTSAKLQRDCECPGTRVSPQENHSEVKRGRESFDQGLHMSWIVELHASVGLWNCMQSQSQSIPGSTSPTAFSLTTTHMVGYANCPCLRCTR